MQDTDNSANRIDSREVIARIEELEWLVTEDQISRDEVAELDSLTRLAAKGEEYVEDWEYGAIIINEEHFTDYIKEFVEEIDYETFTNMPNYVKEAIDWEKVAETLMDDYTEIDYEGITFYARTKTD